MRFLLAAYDPSHQAADGSYWAWHHPDLTPELLNRFYYDVAANHRPVDPGNLSVDDLHAGFATLSGGWCCWYRFVNGGRDQRGRRGRFVLLCAFGQYDQMIGHDGSVVLRASSIRLLARLALGAPPLAPPVSLECEIDLVPLAAGPNQIAQLLQTGHVKWQDANDGQAFREIGANLPAQNRWTGKLMETGDQYYADISQLLKSDRTATRRFPPSQITQSKSSSHNTSSRSVNKQPAALPPPYAKSTFFGIASLALLVGAFVIGRQVTGSHRSPADTCHGVRVVAQPSTEADLNHPESRTEGGTNGGDVKGVESVGLRIDNEAEMVASTTARRPVLVECHPWIILLCFSFGLIVGFIIGVAVLRPVRKKLPASSG